MKDLETDNGEEIDGIYEDATQLKERLLTRYNISDAEAQLNNFFEELKAAEKVRLLIYQEATDMDQKNLQNIERKAREFEEESQR